MRENLTNTRLVTEFSPLGLLLARVCKEGLQAFHTAVLSPLLTQRNTSLYFILREKNRQMWFNALCLTTIFNEAICMIQRYDFLSQKLYMLQNNFMIWCSYFKTGIATMLQQIIASRKERSSLRIINIKRTKWYFLIQGK